MNQAALKYDDFTNLVNSMTYSKGLTYVNPVHDLDDIKQLLWLKIVEMFPRLSDAIARGDNRGEIFKYVKVCLKNRLVDIARSSIGTETSFYTKDLTDNIVNSANTYSQHLSCPSLDDIDNVIRKEDNKYREKKVVLPMSSKEYIRLLSYPELDEGIKEQDLLDMLYDIVAEWKERSSSLPEKANYIGEVMDDFVKNGINPTKKSVLYCPKCSLSEKTSGLIDFTINGPVFCLSKNCHEELLVESIADAFERQVERVPRQKNKENISFLQIGKIMGYNTKKTYSVQHLLRCCALKRGFDVREYGLQISSKSCLVKDCPNKKDKTLRYKSELKNELKKMQ